MERVVKKVGTRFDLLQSSGICPEMPKVISNDSENTSSSSVSTVELISLPTSLIHG